MATTTMKKAIRYIDDTHAQVTKAFEKKACVFGTEEFYQWREYKAIFPNAMMINKSIKKNPNQKTRRNMTYDNMKAYTQSLDFCMKRTLIFTSTSHTLSVMKSIVFCDFSIFPKHQTTIPLPDRFWNKR